MTRSELLKIAKGILFKWEMALAIRMGRKTQTRRLKSRYDVGNILYIKEPYALFNGDSAITRSAWTTVNSANPLFVPKWKNSLFMPKKYADQFILVTKLRIEHIQDITCNEILNEGVDCPFDKKQEENSMVFDCKKCCKKVLAEWGCADLRAEWIRLWNSINKDKGTTYQDNPVVYAYTFKVLKYT